MIKGRTKCKWSLKIAWIPACPLDEQLSKLACSRQVLVQLADHLPGPLPIRQVRMKIFCPIRKSSSPRQPDSIFFSSPNNDKIWKHSLHSTACITQQRLSSKWFLISYTGITTYKLLSKYTKSYKNQLIYMNLRCGFWHLEVFLCYDKDPLTVSFVHHSSLLSIQIFESL